MKEFLKYLKKKKKNQSIWIHKNSQLPNLKISFIIFKTILPRDLLSPSLPPKKEHPLNTTTRRKFQAIQISDTFLPRKLSSLAANYRLAFPIFIANIILVLQLVHHRGPECADVRRVSTRKGERDDDTVWIRELLSRLAGFRVEAVDWTRR